MILDIKEVTVCAGLREEAEWLREMELERNTDAEEQQGLESSLY